MDLLQFTYQAGISINDAIMDDVILHGCLAPGEDEKLCESHVF